MASLYTYPGIVDLALRGHDENMVAQSIPAGVVYCYCVLNLSRLRKDVGRTRRTFGVKQTCRCGMLLQAKRGMIPVATQCTLVVLSKGMWDEL